MKGILKAKENNLIKVLKMQRHNIIQILKKNSQMTSDIPLLKNYQVIIIKSILRIGRWHKIYCIMKMTRAQILNEAVCVFLCANALRKSRYSHIFSLVLDDLAFPSCSLKPCLEDNLFKWFCSNPRKNYSINTFRECSFWFLKKITMK